jgi:hypothetical protein
MRAAHASGARRTTRLETRWVLMVALAAVLAGLLTIGGASSASAASRPKHTTHHTTRKTPPPSVPAFALDITGAQAWNYLNQSSGYVSVQTQPGAALSIRVTYCGRAVNDPNLTGTAKANETGQYAGQYAWNWTAPGTTCRSAKATVKAQSGGKSVTKSTTFAIQPVG